MKHLLLLFLFAVVPALAQQAKKPPVPTPTAAPPISQTGKICDVTYAAETETTAGQDVASSAITLRAVPWVDVVDNHKKQIKVLDALSKAQDKGGEYEITVVETNTCDGGATVRVDEGSAWIKGVTLADSVKVMDVAIQQMKEINDRYRSRAAKGAKVGWDHSKAKKVKRNDLGQKVKE